MDSLAERTSGSFVESLFRDDPFVRKASDALQAFFKDPDADLALRKSYHVIYERRLRNRALIHDPAEGAGFSPFPVSTRLQPLDEWAEADLAAVADLPPQSLRVPAVDRIRLWVSASAWVLAVVGAAVLLPFKHGVGALRRRNFDVALPNQGNNSVLEYLRGGAMKYGVWRPNGLVTILENPIHVPPSTEFPIIRPRDLKIPLGIWMREILPAAVRLVFAVTPCLLARPHDSRVVTIVGECCHLAVIGMKFVPLATNLRVNAYVDTAEYNPIHIVRRVLFRRFGTGPLVRLPHSQMDTPGATLSYLSYDEFLSAGPYQMQSFGSTWSKSCRATSIGMFRNDQYFRDREIVELTIKERIESQVEKGKTIIAFFGSAAMPVLKKPAVMVLRALIEFVRGRDDCFLVIKPKGKHGADWLYSLLGVDGVSERSALGDNVLLIDYVEPGQEVCASGWLIDQMTFGVGFGGSAPIEALSAGKPFLVSYPVLQDTGHSDMLRRNGRRG